MATILNTAPYSPAYQRDSNFVVLETDQVTLAPATVTIDISSTGPSLAETLELSWQGISLEFTVAATTSADALSIPEKDGGDTLAEYADIVAEALRQNDVLTTDFWVKRLGLVGSAERIRLEARVAQVLDVTAVNGLTNVSVAVVDGVASTAVDNLSAYLQVFQKAADPNDDSLVAALHAPFDMSTSQAIFDLKGLFDLAPALPSAITIGSPIAVAWPRGEAVGAYANFYLRYAEKYGVPAVAEALLKSSDYYVLYGGRPGDVLPGSSGGIARLQHGYTRADGATFVKPVAYLQPDWTYVYIFQACTDCRVELIITWDNGDTTTVSSTGDPFDLAANKIYWLQSGFQRGFGGITPPSGASDMVFYQWRLLGDYGSGEALLIVVNYKIYCGCSDQNVFLLMDNGVAGMESVLFRGRSKWAYTAERDTARRLRWNGHTAALGDLFTFNAEGQQTIELNTGWHDKYYIEHLRQLLIGDLWLIDTVNKRFLRVIADSKQFDVYEHDQQLHSLTLSIRAAWLDTAAHLKI